MARTVWFITHPDVVIDAEVPVPDWRLSDRGLARMRALAGQAWARGIDAVWSSTERKARDAAEILGGGTPPRLLADLGENDRSSTGYLPRAAFEALADAFFARPHDSVQGWERAVDAQARIVRAVDEVITATPVDGVVAIVSHGAVGALLLCHLSHAPISRAWDQPPGAGGHLFCFSGDHVIHGWRAIEHAADDA